MKKKCLICNNWFDKGYNVSLRQWKITKYCSQKCYFKNNPFNRSGDKHHSWKGDNINYHSIHDWLQIHFKKEKCENPNCSGKSKNLDWCLIKGKEHKRRRNHYICLCHSCHFKYDYTDEWRKKSSISHINYYQKLKSAT